MDEIFALYKVNEYNIKHLPCLRLQNLSKKKKHAALEKLIFPLPYSVVLAYYFILSFFLLL
jgi:hypothetical protein